MSLRRSARVAAAPSTIIREEVAKEAAPLSEPARKRRKTAPLSQEDEKPLANGSPTFAVPQLPVTPRTRKTRTAGQAPPPVTPTPSVIGFMTAGQSYSTGDIDDATPLPGYPIPRPAEPHTTNAPLKTPKGTRVTAYPSKSISTTVALSPSKPPPTSTTATLLTDACAHLIGVDPRLKPLVEKHHCRIFSPEGLAEVIDPFRSLASGIMAQQVSGAAAKSIKNKFIGLFNDPSTSGAPSVFPTPDEVAKTDIARLRLAGLSQRKAEYIKGLAEKFVSGELSAQMLVNATDEEVLEKLTAVRGLGRWSVEMFACFGLKRMDVLSTGDLGVQRGMAVYIGKDVNKLKAKGGNNKWKYMSEKDMLDISAKFAPYRSLFMWYMWRIENVDVEAIEGA